MRITVGRLKTIIQEELSEYSMKMKKKYKRDEDEEKEESSEEERPSTILDDLKILSSFCNRPAALSGLKAPKLLLQTNSPNSPV